jgi:hypothetical protein
LKERKVKSFSRKFKSRRSSFRRSRTAKVVELRIKNLEFLCIPE